MDQVILLFFFIVFKSHSQESIIQEIKLDQLDTLIELALANNPQRKITEKNEVIAKSLLNASKMSFFEAANASYFYRPENRTALDPMNPYAVNGWQFSVTLSPGTLLQKPHQIKQAKAAYEVSKLESENYKLELINEVKSRYYDYILSLSDVKSKTQAAQDAEAFFEDVKIKYEDGEVEMNEYTESRVTFYAANADLKQAEVAYLKARDLLEQLVGIKLADL